MEKETVDLNLEEMPQYFSTFEEIADFFGLKPNTIASQWTKHPDFPKKSKQGYRASTILKIYREKKSNNVRDRSGTELKDEKTRKEIEMIQIRIDQMRGELISNADHVAETIAVLGAVKSELLSLDKNMLAEGVPSSICAKIRKVSKETLNRMSKKIGELE